MENSRGVIDKAEHGNLLSQKSFRWRLKEALQQNNDLAVVLLVAVNLALALRFHFFIQGETSFFDDVFIYLHVAYNAIYHGTMQYYPISGRHALLASSPLKMLVFVLATYFLKIAGVVGHNLSSARSTIEIAVYLQFLMFLPIWRKAIKSYLVVSMIYFYYAAGLLGISEFESGLVYFWVCSLLYLQSCLPGRRFLFSSFLVLGFLIRPEFALIAALLYVVNAWLWEKGGGVIRTIGEFAASGFLVFGVWGILAIKYKVWPIPVTWWAKAAMPLLADNHYMIRVFCERFASVFFVDKPLLQEHGIFGCFYVACVAWMCYLASKDKKTALTIILLVVSCAIVLMSRMSANFWWYYHNMGMLILAIVIMMILQLARSVYWRSAFLAVLAGTMFLFFPAWGKNPDLPWDFSHSGLGRAPSYLYVVHHFQGGAGMRLMKPAPSSSECVRSV